MNDLPPDAERLRTLETYLCLQLDAVRAQLRHAEQPRRPGPQTGPGPAAGTNGGRGAVASPPYRLVPAHPPHPATLHLGDCTRHEPEARPLSLHDAQVAWTDPGLLAMLDPCPDCHPERTLPPRT